MHLSELAKSISEDFIKEHDLYVIPHLPYLDNPSNYNPPSANQAARRLLVLGYLIGIRYGAQAKELTTYLKSYKLWDVLSFDERELLKKADFTEHDKIKASWLTECTEVIAWALGLTEIDHFVKAKEEFASTLPIKSNPDEFIAKAILRPFQDIYMQADLIYRLHWIAREAKLNNAQCPLDSEILDERHRAINWLIGEESNWDEITTDT